MAKTPRAVHVLTALLLLSGGLTGVLATGPVGRWWLLAPLAVALVVGESLQVEFAYGRDVRAVDVFEAVLAPVLLLFAGPTAVRSEEHTSELQSLMRISYAVFCLKKKKTTQSI